MRVLLYEPSRFGGLQVYTEGLAGGLSRLGVSVSLLTRPAGLPGANGYEVIERLRDSRRPVGRFAWPFDRLTTAVFNSIKLALEASSGYDVCHLQRVQPLFDWLTLRMINIPLVLTVHDVLPHVTRWWERRSLYKSSYRAVDRIIVHSRHNAEVLVEVADVDPAKVNVVPHGLDPLPVNNIVCQTDARRQLDLPLDVPIALAFGGIRQDKGLDVALHAISLVGNWVLVVAGESYGHSTYVALAESLGVGRRVFWRVGFVPDELVSLYFSAADVVALPYKPSFESQSGVLFQAYRHHKPVVATNVGGLGEVVHEDRSGIVVPPDDPQAFADGMVAALQLKPHIAWTAIEHKYSWHTVAEATLKVYRQALGDHRARRLN